MPHKPLKPCKHPGCPKLIAATFCEEHKHLHGRATASERGYDHKWRLARKNYLKENPFCAKCQRRNRLVKAEVIRLYSGIEVTGSPCARSVTTIRLRLKIDMKSTDIKCWIIK